MANWDTRDKGNRYTVAVFSVTRCQDFSDYDAFLTADLHIHMSALEHCFHVSCH